MRYLTLSILLIKNKSRKSGTEGLSNLPKVTLLVCSGANFTVSDQSTVLPFRESVKPPVFRPAVTLLWPNRFPPATRLPGTRSG